MNIKPIPELYDMYWQFAAKRLDIFYKKLERLPRSDWTDDPVLQEYKFTNCFRAADRTSQFLIQEVIYKGDQSPDEIVFRILLFKMFNNIGTWLFLKRQLGEICLDGFNVGRYLNALALKPGKKFSGAYMLSGSRIFGYDSKAGNHIALVEHMIETAIVERLQNAKAYEDAFGIMRAYPLIGGFLAYQLITDVNYSTVIDFDENDFTYPGGGAYRGILKIFDYGDDLPKAGKDADLFRSEIIMHMTAAQDEEFAKRGIRFRGLWGRPLKAIDIQNLLCEMDKYLRKARPDIRVHRKRIKSRYRPSGGQIRYWFPPKWGLNDAVAEDMEKTGTDYSVWLWPEFWKES